MAETRARQAVRLGDMPLDPVYAERQRLHREVDDAEAAFREAVINDWPNAILRYLAWCAARDRLNAASIEPVFVDYPRFSQLVEQIAYRAAVDARKAS